jgi:hypothetical protein
LREIDGKIGWEVSQGKKHENPSVYNFIIPRWTRFIWEKACVNLKSFNRNHLVPFYRHQASQLLLGFT